MAKPKVKRVKLSDTHYLEGTQFDWVLVTLSEGVNKKTGKKSVSERRHYFPRLTQIATHLVAESAKGAHDYSEFIETVNRSTQEITQTLMGVEERLSAQGNKTELANLGDEEGDNAKEKTEKEPARGKSTTTRRRRRKKA